MCRLNFTTDCIASSGDLFHKADHQLFGVSVYDEGRLALFRVADAHRDGYVDSLVRQPRCWPPCLAFVVQSLEVVEDEVGVIPVLFRGHWRTLVLVLTAPYFYYDIPRLAQCGRFGEGSIMQLVRRFADYRGFIAFCFYATRAPVEKTAMELEHCPTGLPKRQRSSP